MRSISTLLLIILAISNSCGQTVKQDNLNKTRTADDIYNFIEYNRFILLKSKGSFNSAAKIIKFGKLPKEGNAYNHIFDIGGISDWEFIRVRDELDNRYFYNIAYFMLGFGQDDPNHADKSVIILTDKRTNKAKYLGLIDKQVTQTDGTMLLISDSGSQYIVDILSNTYKTVENKFNFTIKDFLNSNEISVDEFEDPVMVTLSIKFNEKTSR